MAQIDGCEPFKVGFNAERDSVVTLAAALPKGVHHAKVMYVIEGLFRKPEFRGFVLDKGCQLVEAPALPERKIEFMPFFLPMKLRMRTRRFSILTKD